MKRKAAFRKSAGKDSVSAKHTMNYKIRKQGGRAPSLPSHGLITASAISGKPAFFGQPREQTIL